MYSNGHSKIILGKAIKQLNLPRDEIVVMTKVCMCIYFLFYHIILTYFLLVHGVVKRGFASINAGNNDGYVNQHGLSRKV